MALSAKYDPSEAEPRLQKLWDALGVHRFPRQGEGPVYSIDTPPPTVSGRLHLGHVFSYSHTDFAARFHRMRGHRVYYPMGYDDNGLPTERLVEKTLKADARSMGRQAFVAKCLEISTETEKEYRGLWTRLGLSIDWEYTYRTIEPGSRRTSQHSFLDLYRKGRIYRSQAPTLWCPECRTALAQADLNDLARESVFHTLTFTLPDGNALPIATTRPELLPACVAILVHPEDDRFRDLVGREVIVPLFDQRVPVRTDPQADPQKGTGAVMVCTFGDATDVEWWRLHHLPLVEALDREGRLLETAGEFRGLAIAEARRRIVEALKARNLLIEQKPLVQTVRVHERCDTPVEHLVTRQWFISVLDRKEELLAAGEKVDWRPESMKVRFRQWVENLSWDWCISRQRDFGVPFPLWTCEACGEVLLAEEKSLPIDPLTEPPPQPCRCGGEWRAEEDVLDTWATSSISPQIAGRWLEDPELYKQVFPMSLRPQAHEIIRTWAFYTMVKSLEHFGTVPWKTVAISGWGLAPEGAGKISKSRGGGPMPPLQMIEKTSADAVRYWAASTGLGKDSVISEEKIRLGLRLVTKLWNVARFAERFLGDGEGAVWDGGSGESVPWAFTPADRWILSRTQRLIREVTAHWEAYDHATALHEMESYFWNDLADNYLEMAKQRLYETDTPGSAAARKTLQTMLPAVVKLFAPVLPHVCEEIYQGLFAGSERCDSVHRSAWPNPAEELESQEAEAAGTALLDIARAVRRHKSERGLALGSRLASLHLAVEDTALEEILRGAECDLRSVTRAERVQVKTAVKKKGTEGTTLPEPFASLPGAIQLPDAGEVRAWVVE